MPEQFRELGYPEEQACMVIDSRVRAHPIGVSTRDRRPFKHRNPTGDLCLFYTRDNSALTWQPEDGLEQFLAIVQRHFAAEEFNRRNGYWPYEDAPHGEPLRGTHPILLSATQRELKRWKRAT